MSKTTPTASIAGWVLIAKYEDEPAEWLIAWMDLFSSKKRALEFAKKNNWQKPYRAVRGRMTTDQ